MSYINRFSLLVFVLFFGLSAKGQVQSPVHPDVILVTGIHDTLSRLVVQTEQIYKEGLDTMPQMIFWRKIMNMSPDSGLLSQANTRRIFCSFSGSQWDKMGETGQTIFRDSIRKQYGISDSVSIYFTRGKNDFYNPSAAIPQIDRAIPIFVRDSVDPFYAQAILLIESPGKVGRSNVGAMGSFQLMKSVAIKMGLKVNKSVDERKDFEKSAWAAAKLIRTICIPSVNTMLNKRGIAYNPNDLWYRLLVLHVYHAGAGNVEKALAVINPSTGGIWLIKELWHTQAGSFGKASQTYSQVALAALLEMDRVLGRKYN
jgi:Transglycosylase SLT domain